MTGMPNVVEEKSKDFAVRAVKLYKYLCKEKQEYVISKQVLRSGTSIGANIAEAQEGQSKKVFISKMSIALSEARETMYWLELLVRTEYITKLQYESINEDCRELIKLLTVIIKKSRSE